MEKDLFGEKQAAEQGSPLAHPSHNAPYPPLGRPCLVCEQTAWVWNGEHYGCGSGAAEHLERLTWSWIHGHPASGTSETQS